jgi:radical SAM protein with 4Fe4S-binding SPASM domain
MNVPRFVVNEPLSAPVYVNFALTKTCNMRCKHCYVPRNTIGESKQPSFQEIKKVLERLYDAGVCGIELTGGEPLTYPKFLDVIKIIRDFKGMQLYVVSNGVLWTKDIIRELANFDKTPLIAVSVDGPNNRVHAMLRNTTDQEYARIIENIKLMVEYGLYVEINYLVTKLNSQYYREMTEFAMELNVRSLNYQQFLPSGTGYYHRHIYEFSYDEWKDYLDKLLDYLYEFKKEHKPKMRFGLITHSMVIDACIPLLELGMMDKAKYVFGEGFCPLEYNVLGKERMLRCCEAGRAFIFINSDGKTYTCDCIEHEQAFMGDLRDYDLDIKKLWDESPYLEKFRNIELKEVSEICYKCPLATICGGGCRARATHLAGDFYKPDPYCPFLKHPQKIKILRDAL